MKSFNFFPNFPSPHFSSFPIGAFPVFHHQEFSFFFFSFYFTRNPSQIAAFTRTRKDLRTAVHNSYSSRWERSTARIIERNDRPSWVGTKVPRGSQTTPALQVPAERRGRKAANRLLLPCNPGKNHRYGRTALLLMLQCICVKRIYACNIGLCKN